MKMSSTIHKTILSVLLSLLTILSIQIISYAQNEAPIFTNGNRAQRSVQENTAADENIGNPVSATDEDGDTLTYSLGGTDAESFDIDSDSGQLETVDALDYETKTEYSVTVTVSDGNGGEDSIDVTIKVKDIVDFYTSLSERTPQIKNQIVYDLSQRHISENDIGDQHFSLITSMIVQNKNMPSLANGDFSGLTNLEILHLPANSLESLPEDVFDGLSNLEFLNLSINSLESLPEDIFDGLSNLEKIKLSSNSLESLPEDVFDGLSNLEEIELSSNSLESLPEDIFDGLSNLKKIDLHRNSLDDLPKDVFDGLTSLEEIDLHGNSLERLRYSLFEGLTSLETLKLNDNTGSPLSVTVSLKKLDNGKVSLFVTQGATLDMELNLSASYGNIEDDLDSVTISQGKVGYNPKIAVTRAPNTYQAVTLTVDDPLPTKPSSHTGYRIVKSGSLPLEILPAISREPVFTDGSSTTRGVRENAASGENIGDPVSATSYHSEYTLVYTLGGTDADSFRIDSTSGQLTTRSTLNYYTNNSYSVTVTATDDDDFSSTIDVTINVTNVNDPPQFSEDSTTLSVDENTARGENIGDPLTAIDPDVDDTLTYALRGTHRDKFRIDSETGQLTTHAALDYETLTTYSVTVVVEDEGGLTDSIDVTINVNNAFDTYTSLSQRTSQVAEAIVEEVADANSIDEVIEVDLATITSLNLNDKGISSLQNEDFDGLSALETLNLGSNSLTTLPVDVFDGLSALTDLDLSSNSLETLPGRVFQELSALTDLDLSSNSLTSIPWRMFQVSSVLETLDLSSNSLTSIPANAFQEAKVLTDLDLSSNSLESLPERVFEKLTALTDLDLSANSLTELDSKVFQELTVLEALDLSSNSLESLPRVIFNELEDLTDLDISENSLSSLPYVLFVGLTSLNTLALEGNTVDPLKLEVDIETATNSEGKKGLKVEIPNGTTYHMFVSVDITNGTGGYSNASHSSDGSPVLVNIEAGKRYSKFVRVTRNTGETGAVTATLRGFTTEPSSSTHSGYEYELSDTELEILPEKNEAAAPSNLQQIPDTTAFLPNYPNPFNPETWIPYQLANASDVRITIYNGRGVVVRRLDLGHQRAGYYTSRSHAAHWDGKNTYGEPVASGIYFYQLEADNMSTLRKMVILK